MTDEKRLSPEDAMRRLREESANDAVQEVMRLPPAGVDEALKAEGVDPAEAERRAAAAIEAALAGIGEGAEPPASRVAPQRPAPAAWSPTRRRALLGAVAAAVGLAVAVTSGGAIVAFFRGAEPIGPDRYGTPPTSTVAGPTPAQQALALRTEAFAKCRDRDWDACEAKLDAAMQLDPDAERTPEVLAARRAISEARAEKPKPEKLKP